MHWGMSVHARRLAVLALGALAVLAVAERESQPVGNPLRPSGASS